jgi:uncharacterized protein YhaN
VAHKLDARLRGELLRWIVESPQLGLEPAALAKRVPRLPFVLASRLSEDAAQRLCESLRHLGLEAEAVRGGGLGLASLRAKAWKIAGRRALIGLGFLGTGVHAMQRAPEMLLAAAVFPLAAAVHGFFAALKSVTAQGGEAPALLPPVVRASLAAAAASVTAIEARRHRQGLRAVVQRALALREAIPVEERERVEPELAQIVNHAAAAAVRIDELERRLEAADLREGSDATRRDLVERDAWATRLLDAAAQLDALRARWASAQARAHAGELDQAVEGLRAEVTAFEEVQRL